MAEYYYVSSLISKVYKILPMYEENNRFICMYIDSLIDEMVGGYKTFPLFVDKADYYTVINILHYLNDNIDMEHAQLKREVFKAIQCIDRLKSKLRGDSIAD